jgi:hypothetical protein
MELELLKSWEKLVPLIAPAKKVYDELMGVCYQPLSVNHDPDIY